MRVLLFIGRFSALRRRPFREAPRPFLRALLIFTSFVIVRSSVADTPPVDDNSSASEVTVDDLAPVTKVDPLVEEEPLVALPLQAPSMSREGSLERADRRSVASRPSIPSYIWSEVQRAVTQLVKLEEVSVTGNDRVSDNEIRSWAALDRPRFLWDLLGASVEDTIRSHAWAEKVNVDLDFSWRELKPKLSISLREAQPWLVAESKSGSWLISRGGEVLEPLATIKNPAVVMEASEMVRLDGLDSGSKSGSDLTPIEPLRLDYALRVLRLIEGSGGVPFNVERYTLLDSGGLLIVPAEQGYPQVVLRPETPREAATQLQQLGAVLADLRRRGETARRIDLRFDTRAILS